MWICPTFQRPQRLAELAISWEKHAKGKELYVRVWESDPFKEEYLSTEWPEGWHLYTSSAEWCGEAIREFYTLNPNESCYGFIGDDIVLRTPDAIERLEQAAGDWYLAYPNDTIQRHRISTHFCIGGKLANTLGWIVPNTFRHNYMDVPIYYLAINTGLLRYCPDIIFHHKHFIRDRAEKDATYERIYPNGATSPTGPIEDEGKRAWDEYYAGPLRKDVKKVMGALKQEFEDEAAWNEEDLEMYNAAAV